MYESRPSLNKYAFFSTCIFMVAFLDSFGSLMGYWSVLGNEKFMILTIESLVLLALLINSYAILRWVYRKTNDSRFRLIAWMSFVSLSFCVVGDIVNFNLPQTYYRYVGVIKHDYLADSVLPFSVGYSLLLISGILIAITKKVKPQFILMIIIAGACFGGVSFALMHLPGTGKYVTVMTGGYAILIGVVGFFGIVFVKSFGGMRASRGVWFVGIGFVLAAIADAVIGNFWIYANNGEGYFPVVRYVNWIIYIGSQSLVIHLPRVFVLGVQEA